ncbi:Crp/Fnr family transcriptional regulator [Candidatus Latescibacterota bacterium]
MREIRRSGYDRRQGDSDEEKAAREKGKDRRSLNNNYYQFIKILKKIPIFKNLRVDQFQYILNICAKNTFYKDDTIFVEGEESLEMYILIHGELKITFIDGKELSLIKPVGIVGEMGIFTGEPRSASVTAATDCLLFTIHRKELFKVFEKDSFLALQILMNVIKDLSHKLRNNNVIIDELRQVAFPGDYSKVLSKTMMEENKDS